MCSPWGFSHLRHVSYLGLLSPYKLNESASSPFYFTNSVLIALLGPCGLFSLYSLQKCVFYATSQKSVFYFISLFLCHKSSIIRNAKYHVLPFVALNSRRVNKNFAYRFGLALALLSQAPNKSVEDELLLV